MTNLRNNQNSDELQVIQCDTTSESWAGVSIELPSPKRQGVCTHCHSAFTTGGRGPGGKFCSDECRQKHKHGIDKDGTKPCAHCAARFPFTPTKGRPRKYCSNACQSAAAKASTAARCGERQRTPNGLNCEVCAAPLSGVHAKRFCSPKCRGAGLTPPNKGHSIVPERNCQNCGATFRPNEIGDTGKYCSRPCARRAKRVPARWLCDRPSEPKACAECGGLFEPKYKSQVVCAKACRIRRSTRSQQAKLHPERGAPRNCVVCGINFAPVYGSWTRDKCSEKCSAVAEAERERRQRRIARSRRRALERDPNAERVDPIKVFERDKWHCQLCGRKTPRKLRGKHEPTSPELDHIVPLSRGGPHTYANTQCACRECNGNKGANVAGQLNFNL